MKTTYIIFQSPKIRMTNTEFSINYVSLSYKISDFPLAVNSFPNPYKVTTIGTLEKYQEILRTADFIIIDRNVSNMYKFEKKGSAYVLEIEATEENKNMDTVLKLIDSMMEASVSEYDIIAVGGVIQDITACACALFRRGQPFNYLPTTSLGQLDSCVGAKCAINTKNAKNIIGLFSAPRQVMIPTFMINTMTINDHRAGLAEMLRLCLTASDKALEIYKELFTEIKNPKELNTNSYKKALSLSLSIKKSVVDFDEYEKDIRRSMNYGHTFGHAIEKLVDFTIPHGIAVLIGMHMSNLMSYNLGLMKKDVLEAISKVVRITINGTNLNLEKLQKIETDEIIDQFRFDKKGDGESVPLILIHKPGKMYFHRHHFNSDSGELKEAIFKGLDDISKWVK